MKKKTIATSLLTILVATYAAPFVSAEETTSVEPASETVSSTDENTEIKVPGATEDTTAPSETTPSETTPSETAPSETTPSEATPKADGTKESATPKVDGTKESNAPETVKPVSEPTTKAADGLTNYKVKAKGDVEAYGAANGATSFEISKTVLKIENANTIGEIDTIVQTFKDTVDNQSLINLKVDLKAELEAANKGVNADITAQINAIGFATTKGAAQNAYNNGMEIINAKKKADAKLLSAKEQAKNDVESHYKAGKLDATDAIYWLDRISNARTVEEVQDILDDFHNIYGIDHHDVIVQNPGTTDPGTTNPGTTNPGTTNPGTTNPGTTNPGASNNDAGVDLTAKPSDNPANNTLVTDNNKVDNKPVVKNTATAAKTTNKAGQLPQTGETVNNFTALGLLSVALGSLAMVFKRKNS